MFLPSISTRPELTSRKRWSIESTVDLPEPERPTKPTRSPGSMRKLKSCSTEDAPG